MLRRSPSPEQQLAHDEPAGALPPSCLLPSPAKKRRVTISGAPHALNTDVRAPTDQTNSTPISPVVMGFTIKRDNPSAIEQVRSMITVKQKQKALIEQRRGSVAGVMSPSAGTGNPPATPAEEKLTAGGKPIPARSSRRSPNTGSGVRRLTNASGPGGGNTGPPSPNPLVVPSQQPMQVPSQIPTQAPSSHALPPPINSFARRRAGQLGAGKKKPADIVISPRETQTQEQFQPAIQSAPPVPHAGQGSFYSGRFPMTLPRIPSVMGGGDNVRRVASNVPPTPTRLLAQRNASNTMGTIATTITGLGGRSPPAASVPIASTLVPPTPSLFHHPGYSGDKSAFLAPFEVFYDALNDSKQLKNWLGEQLQRSNLLMQTLTQQQEKLNETVETLVEQKAAGMRAEMVGLHRRVEELEDALRAATVARSQSAEGAKTKGKQPSRNGSTPTPVAPDSYTFPPVPSVDASRLRRESMRRPSSPAWGQDRDTREVHNAPDSENGSPAPFDARRLSVSATRLDPPRPSLPEAQLQARASISIHSPPQSLRDAPSQALAPPTTHGKSLRNAMPERDRPGLHRQSSHSHASGTPGERGSSPVVWHNDSRRNSVVMSPPDALGSDS